MVALLSSLLPERRTDRVYGIQTATLTRLICRSLALPASRAKDLQAYKTPGHGDLADCIERVLQDGGPPALPVVTVEEVDSVLLGLAGSCRFSDRSINGSAACSSSQSLALGNLFRRLHSAEAKWLVRLILKDFAPVRLDEAQVLRSMHFLLPDILRFQQDCAAQRPSEGLPCVP